MYSQTGFRELSTMARQTYQEKSGIQAKMKQGGLFGFKV
jgi:hypothetical protein